MAAHYTGHARVSMSHPRAFGVCQRCGFLYNLDDLAWQMEFAGKQLINTRWRVCPTCLDPPTPTLARRSITLPPDPVPVRDPRPEYYDAADSDYRVTETGETRITEADDPRVAMEDGDTALDEFIG